MTETQWTIVVFAMMAFGGWFGFMWGYLVGRARGYRNGRAVNRWPNT